MVFVMWAGWAAERMVRGFWHWGFGDRVSLLVYLARKPWVLLDVSSTLPA